MRTRRQFLNLALTALTATIAERVLPHTPLVGAPAPATPAPAAPLSIPTAMPAFQLRVPSDLAYAAPPPGLTPMLPLTPTPAPTPSPTTAPAPVFAPTRVPVIAEATATPELPQERIFIPLVERTGLYPGDLALLGSSSGTPQQATSWLAPFATGADVYTYDDVSTIVAAYAWYGDLVQLDWFLALAQMAHETANLTSWWVQRPRQNPAGIGVTGAVAQGTIDQPPGAGWTWDDRSLQWREGWTFETWANHAIPAHLGRLLAYALTDEQATEQQLMMINYALSYRSLPASYRGTAPTICGLNGRWAVPGTSYGQSIIALMEQMRGG